MADIDFNGGKGVNMNDPKFGRDGVNFQTLKRFTSSAITISISTGTTTINNGINTFTAGTFPNVSINITDASLNNLYTSGTTRFFQASATTFSAGTLFSGSTDLYDIFSNTKIQPGTNTYTGGTINRPTVNISALTINTLTASGTSYFTNGLSANILSAGTIFSASTDLYDIFSTTNTRIQPGTNTYTGGTPDSPTINVSALTIYNLTASGESYFTGGLSANTLSGGTILSASTDLYDIFEIIGTGVQAISQGSNILTGGTTNFPIINTVSSPSFNNINFSGTATGGDLFAQNIQIGSSSLSGNVTIWGDVVVMGQSISAFTSQLYVEDNNIYLNFNPTADTTSTSLGAGWTIQDGSGTVGTDAFFNIMGTASTVDDRSFSTNLNDIRIRESGTISSPNGARVLADGDFLDAGEF